MTTDRPRRLHVQMCALVISVLAISRGLVAADSGRGIDEYSARAALVLNLARFVSWPERPADRFHVCVLGEAAFVPVLRGLLVEQRVAGRAFSVHQLDEDSEWLTCHVLYVGGHGRHVRNVLLDAPDGTLTIGEPHDFIRDGGAVRLFIREGRLRFEISQEAVQRAGLRIPAQVLKLSGR